MTELDPDLQRETESSPWAITGPFASPRWVEMSLGIDARQVNSELADHRLLGVRMTDGVLMFPSSQFVEDEEILTVSPNMEVVAKVLREFAWLPDDPRMWTFWSILLGKQPELGGRTMLECIHAGEQLEVVEVLTREHCRAVARLSS